MSLTPQFIDSRSVWDEMVARFETSHALQGWLWGDFKSRWGWQPQRIAWQDDSGEVVAATQILSRSVPKTPWRMLYLPKGPAWNYQNLAQVTATLQAIETYARRQRAIFVKIDPDVPLAFEPNDAAVDEAGQAVRQMLGNRGWQYSSQQIQFKNTVLLDLTRALPELEAAMKSKWRYNRRLAGRKGVTVRTGTVADLPQFYQLYATTSQRNQFLIRPEGYYLDVWQSYLQAQNAGQLLLAEVDGRLVAGVFLFFFGQTAWYLYGASDNRDRRLMPNHLLQWAAIQVAQSKGCTRYDLWGAPDEFVETDSMWGVYRFKKGMGGYTRQGLGAYDFPVYGWLYHGYVELLPKLLAWRRRLG